jgi:hypothetical protein
MRCFAASVSVLSALLLLLHAVSASSVKPRSVASAAKPRWLLNVGSSKRPIVTADVPSSVALGEVELLTAYFGAMPCLGCANHPGKWCNGGIPQLANVSYHVQQMEHDMKTAIPDEGFAGYIVHDWESWSVPWELAQPAYHNASVALARSEHPTASEAQLEAIAREAYTTAGIALLVKTVETSRRLRPNAAGVGFYGLPYHQYWPTPQLNATQQGWNTALLPLWKAVTAIFPSIYLPYESDCHDAGCAPLKRNQAYVDAALAEAVRVAKLVQPQLPVLPYAWYRYHDGEPKGLQMLTDADTALEFSHPLKAEGVSQVIIWGSEATTNQTNQLLNWFKTEAAVFGGKPSALLHEVEATAGVSASKAAAVGTDTTRQQAAAADGAPVWPRDGPVPKWLGCGL